MTITFPGINTGPFGGPAGSTRNAIMQLVQGMMTGREKTEQKDEMGMLADIFQTQPGEQPGDVQSIINKLFSSGITRPGVMKMGLTGASAMPQPKQATPIAPGTIKPVQIGDKNVSIMWDGKKWTQVAEGDKWQDKETWGAPKSGVIDGKPGFFQTNNKGETRQLTMEGKSLVPEPKKGMKIYDREGNLILDTSGGTGDMTRKTQGAIEEKILNSDQLLMRTEDMMNKLESEDFPKEIFTYKGKIDEIALNLKEKAGYELDEGQKQYVEQMSTFAQDAIDNINLYIKAITGAQMSEKEADRLRKAMPDFGENWWKGDGYTKFTSKLKNVIRKAKLSKARMLLLKEKGLELTKDNIEKAESVYNYDRLEKMLFKEKANEIGEMLEMQYPDKGTAEIKQMIRQEISKRYGI